MTFNYSWDTDFRVILTLYQKCPTKPYSSLVIHATFASGKPLRFRKNLLNGIQKLILTIDDKVRNEKLQYNIDREVTKISFFIIR